jgi:hypothetical protein
MYVCTVCNRPVTMSGQGLKTATCSAHPYRTVTVIRDFSGGKEADKGHRETAVSVSRHTKVRVVKQKEAEAS